MNDNCLLYKWESGVFTFVNFIWLEMDYIPQGGYKMNEELSSKPIVRLKRIGKKELQEAGFNAYRQPCIEFVFNYIVQQLGEQNIEVIEE